VQPLLATALSPTVLTTSLLVAALGVGSWLASRHLRTSPAAWQCALEAVVETIDSAVADVLPGHSADVVPLIGTLWIFIVLSNLIGLVPGIHGPTGDLSLTAALATIVFFAVHGYGIRANGWARYLKHYLEPNPILLPFQVISELSRTVALAVRLFGNIFSLELAALLVVLVGGLLVPVPLLLLHVVEALVQAYIFGMLALVYIAGAMQSIEARNP
jgi:F-type H+-transporting ATPase subunit a